MLDKFKEFIGIDDNYDDYDEDIENEENEESRVSSQKSTNVYDTDFSKKSSDDLFSTYDNSYDSSFSSSKRRIRGGDNIVSMNDASFSTNSSSFRISIQEPISYDEDANKIVDDILNKKVVVLNLELIEINMKQKIVDFVSGAVYALGGRIEKVSKSIFVICPKGINIDKAVQGQISSGNFNQL
ncbi:MAG: cell division protein SepF [Peptoniphilaceae bacterium]|nr:cell division protein SepF [Peptoniphilaceae bacterium]MDY6019584.1 cell division protein SepF [Anaerococcus sp.]